jgi:4,5-dihydroxyphthalate decarboxylase
MFRTTVGIGSFLAVSRTGLWGSTQREGQASPAASSSQGSGTDQSDGVSITFACGLYDRMLALYTGEVRPRGINLKFLAIDSPREIFDRMSGRLEFDASEMSSSEFITRADAGQQPFVALPVFPSRVFRHGHIAVNRKSGIVKPKDLEGKRVGVPLYTQTAAIFIRGLLQHEYDVDLSKIQWVQGEMNVAGTHGHPTVMPLLKKVPIELAPAGKSLSQLIDERAIDATIGTGVPDCIRTNPDVRRLFPNYPEVEREYYKRRHIFPIMHLVAIRREVYEKHKFVAQSMYDALEKSKEIGLAKMRFTGALRYMLPWMMAELDEIDDVFGGDPWPYGVAANRPTLEALVSYMVEQGLIAKPIRIEELFAVQG